MQHFIFIKDKSNDYLLCNNILLVFILLLYTKVYYTLFCLFFFFFYLKLFQSHTFRELHGKSYQSDRKNRKWSLKNMWKGSPLKAKKKLAVERWSLKKSHNKNKSVNE